jgi:hypothetical protein
MVDFGFWLILAVGLLFTGGVPDRGESSVTLVAGLEGGHVHCGRASPVWRPLALKPLRVARGRGVLDPISDDVGAGFREGAAFLKFMD